MSYFDSHSRKQLLWTAIVATALAIVALDQAGAPPQGLIESPAPETALPALDRSELSLDIQPEPSPRRRPANYR